MRLLIVEDEIATRNGLIKSVDWERIGIAQVITAENGLQGLNYARRYRPDIVLTDIRMPQMDGLELADKIREMDTNCPIIFLSAYSDIDYYKAAIRIKAISYIEKPVQMAVLEETIREAISERIASSKIELTVEQQKKHRFDIAAIGLTRLGTIDKAVQELGSLGWWEIHPSFRIVTTVLLQMNSLSLSNNSETINKSSSRISVVENNYQIQSICCAKHDNCMLVQLFSAAPLSSSALNDLCKKVLLKDAQELERYYVVAGKSVPVENAFDSYNSAAHLLQMSFYYPYGSILIYEKLWEPESKFNNYSRDVEAVTLAIGKMDLDECISAANALKDKLRERHDLIVVQAKKIYADLIMMLISRASENHIALQIEPEDSNITWLEDIESYNLDLLHDLLLRTIQEFFSKVANAQIDRRYLLLIKGFVQENYGNDSLSIKDIADHLHISVSHVSALFKKGTGQTLSQYITDHRINEAKKYLRKTGMSVSEISQRVGYKDNSYFGRIFRKATGLTPLEYRDEKLV